MKKRVLYPVLVLAMVLIVAIPMSMPITAQTTSSLVQTLSVSPSTAYPGGTLYYSVTLSNLNIPGANDVIVDIYFYPPGPTGALGAYGTPVLLDADKRIDVGESFTYMAPGRVGDFERAALEVDLGDIPLNAGVTVVYAASEYDGDYIFTPPYDAYDIRNIPAGIVDARISIEDSATNRVGEPHAFNVTVEQHDGTAWSAAANVTVTASLTGVGAITSANPAVTDADGQVSFTVNSETDPGKATVHASATVTVSGVSIDVDTDGYGAHEVDNEKTWVDARISISPLDDTNAVGDLHDLTALVEVHTGDDWEPYEGATVTFEVIGIDSVGIVAPVNEDTDAQGEAKTVLTSDLPGSSTVQASTNITVEGVEFILVTDGEEGDFNAPANKDWVNARISISPLDDTNAVGDLHELTALVEVHTGDDWEPYEGATVTFTRTAGVGSVAPFTDDTDAQGEARTVLTSDVPGSSTVQASTTITVEGAEIVLVTDGAEAEFNAPAEKTWVDARISIVQSGTNPVDVPHDFTVTVERHDGTGWSAASNVTVSASLTGAGNITSANPAETDDAGQVTFTVNSAVAGVATVHASATVDVNGTDIDVSTDGDKAHIVSNQKTWVDDRPPITVGWQTHPVNKAAVLAPWIALLATFTAGATLLLARRRRALM